MSRRSTLTKRNENIRKMLIDGVPVKEIASRYKLHPNSVRLVITNLISTGLLARVPNTTPALYYDPRPRVNITDAERPETVRNDPLDGNNDPPVVLDCLPEGGMPEGFVGWHCATHVALKVRKVGEMRDVGIPPHVVGVWGKPVPSGKGQTSWTCYLNLWGQEVKAIYYESSHGKTQFRVRPGRIYVNTAKINKARARELLVARASQIADLLAAHGWELTDPKMTGDIKTNLHAAIENHVAAQFIPMGHGDGTDDITVDASTGIVETEMEHCDDDEDVRIYANYPSTLKGIKADLATAGASIGKMGSDIKEVREDVEAAKESIRSGDARMDACQATLDKVLAFLDKMAEVEVRRGEVMAMQEANHAKMMEMMSARDSESMSRLMSKDDLPFDGRGYL